MAKNGLPAVFSCSNLASGAVRAGSLAVKILSYPVRLLQTGLVQGYALFIVVGVLIFLSYFLTR